MCDLKQLLCSWKLENILPHLIDEEVDVETLKIIKKHHIKALLSGFPLGRLIRFEHNLEQWRFTIGKPVKHAAYDERNDLVFEELTDQHHFRSQPNKNFSKDAQPCINSPINLKEILMENKPEGPELLEMYDKNQTFSNPERSHLIDLIVNHHLRHNISFDLYESYDFENAILSLFPNEKLDYYRNSKQESEIYAKYLKAEAVYINNNKEASQISDNLTSHDLMSRSFNHKNKADDVQLVVRKASKNSVKEPDISLSDKSDNYTSAYPQPKEILLKTVYKNCKKFVKIFKPFLLKDFLTSACSIFNLRGRNNMCVVLNGCEISSDDFKNVIPQYYKLPRFNVELKKKAPDKKVEPIENSRTQTDFYKKTCIFTPAKPFSFKEHNKTTVQIIVNHLPNANDIRNIPSLLPIVKMSDDGRPLENKHRTAIAKAIIDECLNFQPERVLKRLDFFTLTDNLIQAFPKETASAYFIPSQPNHAARGKLWNAYNNKRSFLGSSGIVQRRQHSNAKRKLLSDEDEDSERTNDKIYITEKEKWRDCHQERRNELLKDKMPPEFYMQKYSMLKSNLGIDLMEIDVNILHPTVLSVNNWLSLYEKVIEMARKMQKSEPVSRILDYIDSSNDEKYRASLTLLIIPYIFPYNGRRNELNEKASKYDTQKRFIKEYTSLEDLNCDIEFNDLQIRFVHQHKQINYAEFNICGHIFKSVDLMEALSSVFHYTVAMNVEYPKMLIHIWQFIQSAIFQIEIQGYKQPNVESTINDLYMI